MEITDKYGRIPLGEVVVKRDERQRREVDTKGIKESIAKFGVLQPIILTEEKVLVVGERRLRASQELGMATIPFRYVNDLTPIEALIIELEENIKRSDLDWQDIVKTVGRIHRAHCDLDPDWTMGETANSISLSLGVVSKYLTVYGWIDDESVVKAATVNEAWNLLARRGQRAAGDALEELAAVTEEVAPQAPAGGNGPEVATVDGQPVAKAKPRAARAEPVDEAILHESFLQWAPRYKGPKFNLIHCDFPYGVEVFSGPQMGEHRYESSYGDGLKVYTELLECLCNNLPNLMAISAHLMFWFSEKNGRLTRDTFARLAPDLRFTTFPLIWVKSDNAGIAPDVRMGPRHIYETCLLASRGSRNIVKVVSDAYSAPTDKRLHVSAKPVPMLKHFFQMLVDSNTSLLDPTCGSAAALHAAEELGAKRVLGMDIDERTVGVARGELRRARGLKLASQGMGL